MKFSFLFCLILLFTTYAFAQSKLVEGFVVDKDSKLRLAKVYIYNPAIDEGLYNNTKGEFKTNAKIGDTIFAALGGYGMDTVVYKGQNAIVFQLKSLSIKLKEIKILGKSPSASDKYEKNLAEYKSTFDKVNAKNFLNLGPNGVGIGIDAIYNLLSKSGKNARHLQAILERDYHESIIDYRFRPDYVKAVVNINETELKDFMLQYRPTYQFVLSASDYSFVQFVKNSFASYKRNPAAFRLPSLIRVNPSSFSNQKQ